MNSIIGRLPHFYKLCISTKTCMRNMILKVVVLNILSSGFTRLRTYKIGKGEEFK